MRSYATAGEGEIKCIVRKRKNDPIGKKPTRNRRRQGLSSRSFPHFMGPTQTRRSSRQGSASISTSVSCSLIPLSFSLLFIPLPLSFSPFLFFSLSIPLPLLSHTQPSPSSAPEWGLAVKQERGERELEQKRGERQGGERELEQKRGERQGGEKEQDTGREIS